MPRTGQGPHLVLYGPDDRFGAKRKVGFKRYLWYVVWREGGAKREHPTGHERGEDADAQTYFGEWLRQRQPRDTSTRRPDQMTVSEVLDCYATEHAPDAVDGQRIGYAIQALLPMLGDMTLDKLTAGARKKYARTRTKTKRVLGPDRAVKEVKIPVAANTIVRELATMDAAARHCVREGYLTAYPDDQWFPERPDPKERYLEVSEAAALLRAARRPPPDPRAPSSRLHLPLFILIGLYTGRRKESILTLQWQPNMTGGWVDLERGYIDFYPIQARKTKKRRGFVRIPHRLLTFLRYARRRTRTHVIEFEGHPVKSIKRSFSSACRAAGLEGVHPHILRHTLATWLAQRGVEPRRAADFLEMTLETYERRYRKYHPDFQSEALEALR